MATKVVKVETEYIEFSPINLKISRLKKGWSRQQLSEKSGVHLSTVDRAERGFRNQKWSTMQKLADALERPIEHLTTDYEFEIVPVKKEIEQ